MPRNARKEQGAEALPKMAGGLRALYRTLEWTRSRPLARPSQGFLIRKIPFAVSQTAQVPGANPLKDAHAALDTAVLTAYGFSAKKDLLAQFLALNQQVAAKIERGEPVIAPLRALELSRREATGDGGLHQTKRAMNWPNE